MASSRLGIMDPIRAGTGTSTSGIGAEISNIRRQSPGLGSFSRGLVLAIVLDPSLLSEEELSSIAASITGGINSIRRAPRNSVIVALHSGAGSSTSASSILCYPFVYTETPKGFAFGSEIPAVLAMPGVDREINRDALAGMLLHNVRHISDPYTAYRGVKRLRSGHAMLIKSGRIEKVWQYWKPKPSSAEISPRRLRKIIEEAVQLQMTADVPVGAMLSGGVDSSAIVALMARHSTNPIRTYALGFDAADEDLRRARVMARHLGCIHKEFYFNADRQWEIFRKLIHTHGEPIMLLPLIQIQRHRGPDSNGLWISKDQHVGLCHTRLAILDLTINGAQPMHSADGRYVIVFNGEIYNYIEIREYLINNSTVFYSSTDTEVLIEAYRYWGVDMVHRLRGMFSFGIFDRKCSVLFCARDRIGEKPFVYTETPKGFAFASVS